MIFLLIFLFILNQINAYEILSNDHQRIKRVPSPWFYPELDKNFISCGHNVYAKLFICSHPTDCK